METNGYLDDSADKLLSLAQYFGHAILPRRRPNALKGPEYMVLSLLAQQSVIVGDLQRALDVLPAQMSRIIRALENRPSPLVLCSINIKDKRKIDVAITDAGRKALETERLSHRARVKIRIQDLRTEHHQHLLYHLDKVCGILETLN